MSDLYTRFMEWVMPFLQANWQLFSYCGGGRCFCWGDLPLEMGLRSSG